MFRKPSRFVSRTGAISVLFAALVSTSAFAAAPATGLGQAWPNTTDVSVSPHYHVYVFVREGVRYIQVNDLNGTVLAATAVADGVVLVLPIGVDAPYVSTRHINAQSAAAQNTGATETVYSDSTTRITATPTSSGAVQINVGTPIPQQICTNPFNCTGVVSGGTGG